MKPYLLLIVTALSLTMLPGCTGVMAGAGVLGAHQLNMFQNPNVNLTAKNYAAADVIIQQSETFIRRGDVIKVVPLVNFTDPQTPAPIGALISEQIGARLTQLGYNIDLDDVKAQRQSLNISDIIAATSGADNKPEFILGGHYIEDRPDMNVSLRINRIKDNRVVGAFDYTMPTNREIRDLATPKPQIRLIETPQ